MSSSAFRLLLGLGLAFIHGCSSPSEPTMEQPVQPVRKFSVAVQPNPDGTYGYVIAANGRPLIEQPHVPGRAGTQGFRTAEAARRTAALVWSKLQRGIMPPSVTPAELDSLGI